jgi:fructose 1,6-bisphosphatase
MKLTLSVIKADVGSIGGHIKPSQKLKDAVGNFVFENGIKKGEIIDHYVSSTGDDIAILMTHKKGVLNDKVHKLAWDAFLEGTRVAKEQGLYGAGQDLLKDAFSGNVKGMGPAVAEMEIEERPNECFVFFAADKTDPGAYNLPFYLGFADPMYCAGLMLSPKMSKGFKFMIMDVSHTKGNTIKVKKRNPKITMNKTGDQNRNVFITHGHNKVVTAKVKDFVRERLKLTPLILEDQPDEGLTIIEKLEKYACECCFAIIILTKDDITKGGA